MINEYFIDAFNDFSHDHLSLLQLVKAVFRGVEERVLEAKDQLTKSIMSSLNIQSNKDFESQYLLQIYQDFSLDIFKLKEEDYKRIITKIESFIKDINYKMWLECSELRSFIEKLHRLYLHMILSNPSIELSFDKIVYTEFNKLTCHCIDGFPKDGSQCVVVIPAPTKEGSAYQSIKPSVLLIQNHIPVSPSEANKVDKLEISCDSKTSAKHRTSFTSKEVGKKSILKRLKDDPMNLKTTLKSDRESHVKVSWHNRNHIKHNNTSEHNKDTVDKNQLLKKYLIYSKEFLQRNTGRHTLTRENTERYMNSTTLINPIVINKKESFNIEGNITTRLNTSKSYSNKILKRQKGTKTPNRANAELYDKRTRELRKQFALMKNKRDNRENHQIHINCSTVGAGKEKIKLRYIHKAKDNSNILHEKNNNL